MKPSAATNSWKRLRTSPPMGSFPSRYLVAISQALAALTKIKLASFAMDSRATSESFGSSVNHQRSA